VDAREVFADHPEGEELSAREDRDDRGQKREAGHAVPEREVTEEDVGEDQGSEERQREADHARDLERKDAEPRHHVQRVRHELAQRVCRGAFGPGLVPHGHAREAARGPREENVDRDVLAPVVGETVAQRRPEGAKGAPGRLAHAVWIAFQLSSRLPSLTRMISHASPRRSRTAVTRSRSAGRILALS
jgi:hypothetical protein